MNPIDLEKAAFEKYRSELIPVKGFSTVVALHPETFQEVSRMEFLDWHKRAAYLNSFGANPFVLICFLSEKIYFYFFGVSFFHEVDWESGETLDFSVQSQAKIGPEELKKELSLLAQILSNSNKKVG